MESAYTYTSSDLPQAREWTDFQLQSWGVRSSFADWFLTEATRVLGDRTGRVVLDYDAGNRLLSFDVWCEGVRLYGLDDFV